MEKRAFEKEISFFRICENKLTESFRFHILEVIKWYSRGRCKPTIDVTKPKTHEIIDSFIEQYKKVVFGFWRRKMQHLLTQNNIDINSKISKKLGLSLGLENNESKYPKIEIKF